MAVIPWRIYRPHVLSRHLVTAVIPCLNEERSIFQLVRSIQAQHIAAIVVDDGSTDQTAPEARRAGATVLSHSSPRGKGAALITGCAGAIDAGFSWAIFLDGDGQHSPDDISCFLTQAPQSDLIVGNRMNRRDGMPWLRFGVNRLMSHCLSKLAGRPLPDSQCGFRLVSLSKWARQKLAASHFEIESEMLLAFAESNLDISFVPIQVIYRDEQSKIRPMADTWRWLKWWRAAHKRRAILRRTRFSEPCINTRPV